MGILSSLFGFSQNNNLIGLTSVQDSDEAWQDLIFTITKKEKLKNEFWSLICKAKYENQVVGLKINIKNEVPDLDVDNLASSIGEVEFVSIGRK